MLSNVSPESPAAWHSPFLSRAAHLFSKLSVLPSAETLASASGVLNLCVGGDIEA